MRWSAPGVADASSARARSQRRRSRSRARRRRGWATRRCDLGESNRAAGTRRRAATSRRDCPALSGHTSSTVLLQGRAVSRSARSKSLMSGGAGSRARDLQDHIGKLDATARRVIPMRPLPRTHPVSLASASTRRRHGVPIDRGHYRRGKMKTAKDLHGHRQQFAKVGFSPSTILNRSIPAERSAAGGKDDAAPPSRLIQLLSNRCTASGGGALAFP